MAYTYFFQFVLVLLMYLDKEGIYQRIISIDSINGVASLHSKEQKLTYQSFMSSTVRTFSFKNKYFPPDVFTAHYMAERSNTSKTTP